MTQNYHDMTITEHKVIDDYTYYADGYPTQLCSVTLERKGRKTTIAVAYSHTNPKGVAQLQPRLSPLLELAAKFKKCPDFYDFRAAYIDNKHFHLSDKRYTEAKAAYERFGPFFGEDFDSVCRAENIHV